MSTSGNDKQSREEYLNAWSKMLVNIWREKLIAFQINRTGSLMKSTLALPPVRNATDIAVLEHTFNLYGIYVDKGTGREFRKGNGGDLGFTPKRKPKPWFSRKYYYATHRLAERLAEIEGRKGAMIIADVINGE